MTRIDEIRQRLEKASPGPWQILPGNDRCISGTVISAADNRHIATATRTTEERANADFIAHAPEDIEYLLALVEEVTA